MILGSVKYMLEEPGRVRAPTAARNSKKQKLITFIKNKWGRFLKLKDSKSRISQKKKYLKKNHILVFLPIKCCFTL